MTPNFQLLSCY